MITTRIYLVEDSQDVYLDVYAANPIEGFARRGLLVIPGGGYGCVCSDREGEPIGLAFLPYGYNAFVLHYTVGRKKTYPSQLIEASFAVKYIRDHAEEYGIDPEKIFVAGFSAGGHLAGSLGTMWHKEEIYNTVEMPYGYNKPAGMMLIYPVVTGVKVYGHIPSFCNLLGTDSPKKEQLSMCSLEQNVDEKAVPMFVMHTSDDQLVDVRNSLCLAEKYKEYGIPFEMHIYPQGPHGVALGNEITKCGVEQWSHPAIAKWVEHAAAWAEDVILKGQKNTDDREKIQDV